MPYYFLALQFKRGRTSPPTLPNSGISLKSNDCPHLGHLLKLRFGEVLSFFNLKCSQAPCRSMDLEGTPGLRAAVILIVSAAEDLIKKNKFP